MLSINQSQQTIALYAATLLLILSSEAIASENDTLQESILLADAGTYQVLGTPGETAGKTQDFYETYLRGRLELGTRISTSILTDSEADGDGTFLGTIYELDEEQDYTPNRFFARYYFTRHFGLELAYDSIEAETVAPSEYTGTKSDGDVSLAGPTLSFVGRYPNPSRFTPYAFIGVGFYSGDFDESNDWALGYYDPYEYAAMGSPSTAYNGVTRVMDVDDAIGFLFGAGFAYEFTDHLAFDLSFQYTAVEADATFYRYQYGSLTLTRDGSFPLDNVELRAGVTFQF